MITPYPAKASNAMMKSIIVVATFFATQALARPYTSGPLLSNLSTSLNNTTPLGGSDFREYIFEDALEVLLAASPTHDEYDRAAKKMRTFDEWQVVDLMNDDIASYHDGSPISPDTPPQDIERYQAQDFASLVRRAAPFMSQPLDRIPHKSIWELRWDPNVLALHDAIRDVVLYAFTSVYLNLPRAVKLAMEIFDSFELGDLIMWINDSKERDGDESGKLSTQSTVDDLWNKCHLQDLESLCDAIDRKGHDWSRIPWPQTDSIGRHRTEISIFKAQHSGGSIVAIAG